MPCSRYAVAIRRGTSHLVRTFNPLSRVHSSTPNRLLAELPYLCQLYRLLYQTTVRNFLRQSFIRLPIKMNKRLRQI